MKTRSIRRILTIDCGQARGQFCSIGHFLCVARELRRQLGFLAGMVVLVVNQRFSPFPKLIMPVLSKKIAALASVVGGVLYLAQNYTVSGLHQLRIEPLAVQTASPSPGGGWTEADRAALLRPSVQNTSQSTFGRLSFDKPRSARSKP